MGAGMSYDWGEVESDPEFRRQALARLHITARVRICRSPRCPTCRELPKDRPTAPSPENNVLLAMQQARFRAESMRETLPTMVSSGAEEAARDLPRSRASVDQPRPMCPVPPVEGVIWASVQRLVAHAWRVGAESSLCAKRTRDVADWTRAFAPNWCRECQVAVLRICGRQVYIAGNEIRERGPDGTRKLARAERSK